MGSSPGRSSPWSAPLCRPVTRRTRRNRPPARARPPPQRPVRPGARRRRVALASAEPRAGHQRHGRPRSERLLRPLRRLDVHLAERLVLAGPRRSSDLRDGRSRSLLAVVGGPSAGWRLCRECRRGSVVLARRRPLEAGDGARRPLRFPGRPLRPERFHADRLARRRDRWQEPAVRLARWSHLDRRGDRADGRSPGPGRHFGRAPRSDRQDTDRGRDGLLGRRSHLGAGVSAEERVRVEHAVPARATEAWSIQGGGGHPALDGRAIVGGPQDRLGPRLDGRLGRPDRGRGKRQGQLRERPGSRPTMARPSTS